MADSFHVDLRDMDELVVKLRRAAEKGERDVFKTVVAVGEAVKEEASKIAGEHSKSIPPTLKVRPVPPRSVEVQAGGASVPIAALFEIGNKGARSTSKTFRHPVFGRKDLPWVEQPKHPYLRPARNHLRAKAKERLTEAWRRSMRESGIEVE